MDETESKFSILLHFNSLIDSFILTFLEGSVRDKMAGRSVSHRLFFQLTLWSLKSWMVVYLYLLWIYIYTAAVTGW